MIKVSLTNDQYDFLLELFKRLSHKPALLIDAKLYELAYKDEKLVHSIYSILNEQRFNRHGFPEDWPPSQNLPVEIPDSL